MAVTATIVKPLESGFVQVDADYKRGWQRNFKVPQANAERFASDFTKQDKRLNILSNITFFSSIFAGVLGAYCFVKKMDSRFLQLAIETATAIGLSTLTALGFRNYAKGEEDKLLQKNNAKEIFYQA